jgi:hypothetical protein
MLKMDIEGCEWDVLKGMLAAPDEDLPGQLLFELHTEVGEILQCFYI